VTILESKEQWDHHNGEEIERRHRQRWAAAGFPLRLIEVGTVNELLGAIGQESELAIREGPLLLHLEAHGHYQGVETADGGVALWRDLRVPLQRLYVATGGHLILFLGACDGIRLWESLLGPGGLPFAGYVSVNGKVKSEVLARAWNSLYDELLSSRNLNRATASAGRVLESSGQPPLEIVTSYELVAEALDDHVRRLHHRAAIRIQARAYFKAQRLPRFAHLPKLSYFKIVDALRQKATANLETIMEGKLQSKRLPNSPIAKICSDLLATIGRPTRRPNGKQFRRMYLRQVRAGKWPRIGDFKRRGPYLFASGRFEAMEEMAE
jgi:hypothetical protein